MQIRVTIEVTEKKMTLSKVNVLEANFSKRLAKVLLRGELLLRLGNTLIELVIMQSSASRLIL